MDTAAPEIVARIWTDSEASVIKSLLESYSIPCHYSSQLPQRIYPLSVESAKICIYVPAALAQEARRVLEEHRRHTAGLHLVDGNDE